MEFLRRIGIFIGLLEHRRYPTRKVHLLNKPFQEDGVVIENIYPDNTVVSSKYTGWNFLPKNLFEQFRRIANFYFLFVGLIQVLIDSPTSPATSIVPLTFVVLVAMIKQGYEDWLRHRSDKQVNNRPVSVIRDGALITVTSQQIKVGDVVYVTVGQEIPCDMVLISSHDQQGVCHITTANLDGETNLKIYTCVNETMNYTSVESIETLSLYVECQQPISDLYRFIGRMIIFNNGIDIVRSLSQTNLLLRGSTLKNTHYIYGLAIYTGKETKMGLNSSSKATKFSTVERRLNSFLLIFLALLFTESGIFTLISYWFNGFDEVKKAWYIYPHNSSEVTTLGVFDDFLAFSVLFNYIIPISLYVTIELQKFLGSLFFGWDDEMYDEKRNRRAVANTSDLNEELGQVEYLFTDKTGTLTENDMLFRQCSVGGVKYIEYQNSLYEISPTGTGILPTSPHRQAELDEFFLILALCHTVHVDKELFNQQSSNGCHRDGPMTPTEMHYQASSPDEKALVETAHRYGFTFQGGAGNILDIMMKQKLQQFTLLHVLEFDANRRRMAVIVKWPNGDIKLLCKGAESAILPRILTGDKETTLEHVNDYAMAGLRTLVFAKKDLSPDQYSHIDEMLQNAKTALDEREEKLASVFDEVEQDMALLGSTAVEDKLQEGVPETIEFLRAAGINVWILTGDKLETAINISYSCGHFKRGMLEHALINQATSEQCIETLANINRVMMEEMSGQHSFVVDGQSLALSLVHHEQLFLNVSQKCSAVLCCRLSPLQKAQVVRLYKMSKQSPITMAIGDGANDVSMIQEAHVGIGIFGKEGMQAVRCSDYAFSRFRFLLRALLLHGRFYYIRIATIVQYFFYKNVAFITSQLYYSIFNAFSQQTLFDTIYLTFYNMVFTALPILIFGLFEQDLPQQAILNNPQLYKTIRKNKLLNYKHFVYWFLVGVWHSLCFFFVPFSVFHITTSTTSDNTISGLSVFGGMVYLCVIVGVTLKLATETHYWCVAIILSFVLSVTGYLSASSFFNSIIMPFLMSKYDIYFSFFEVFTMPLTWFTLVLTMTLAFIPDITFRSLFAVYDPRVHDAHRNTTEALPGNSNSAKDLQLSTNRISRQSNDGQVREHEPVIQTMSMDNVTDDSNNRHSMYVNAAFHSSSSQLDN